MAYVPVGFRVPRFGVRAQVACVSLRRRCGFRVPRFGVRAQVGWLNVLLGRVSESLGLGSERRCFGPEIDDYSVSESLGLGSERRVLVCRSLRCSVSESLGSGVTRRRSRTGKDPSDSQDRTAPSFLEGHQRNRASLLPADGPLWASQGASEAPLRKLNEFNCLQVFLQPESKVRPPVRRDRT